MITLFNHQESEKVISVESPFNVLSSESMWSKIVALSSCTPALQECGAIFVEKEPMFCRYLQGHGEVIAPGQDGDTVLMGLL